MSEPPLDPPEMSDGKYIQWLENERGRLLLQVKRLSDDGHQDEVLLLEILHFMCSHPGCLAVDIGRGLLPGFRGNMGQAIASGPIVHLRNKGLVTGYSGDYRVSAAGAAALSKLSRTEKETPHAQEKTTAATMPEVR